MALVGYDYRKQLTITGTADGIQTNYQLRLSVNRSSGADSGLTVYLDTKCNADFSDIRFTKSDGDTKLDYWIESVVGTLATVWVEFDSIPISPNTITFYIYYGDADATTEDNGDATFILFDDFTDNSLDAAKWTYYAESDTSLAETGTQLRSAPGATNDKVAHVRTVNSYTITNKAFRLYVRAGATNMFEEGMFLSKTSTGNNPWNQADWYRCQLQYGGSTFHLGRKVATVFSSIYSAAWSAAANYIEVRLTSTSVVYAFEGTTQRATQAYGLGAGNLYWYLCAYRFTKAGGSGTDYFDNALIRNYTLTEPTITAWAAEEPLGLSAPTVTTQAASSVTATTATLNGTIEATGGVNCTVRGFQYGKTSGALDLDVHENGSFGTGAYSLPVTGL